MSLTTGTDEALAVTVTVQPWDGAVVAAGYANLSGNVQFAIARFLSDGSFDAAFGAGGKAYVDFTAEIDYAQALAIQPDGNMVLGGRTLYDPDPGCGGSTIGSYDFLLARLNDDGSLDPTFDGDGKVLTDFGSSSGQGMYDSDYSLVIQPDDGKIVAAGDSYDALNGGRDFAITRYHPDGSLDTTFAGTGMLRTDFRSGTDDTAYAVKLQQHAGVTKILAAGHSRGPSTTETRQDFALIRYNDNGTLDPTFGTGGKVWSDFGGADSEDVVRALEIDSTGRIIAAGYAGNTFAVARYLPGNTVAVGDDGPPAPPGDVTATAVSTGQVDVSWRDRSVHETGYRLERWFEYTGVWRTVAEMPPDVELFSDTEVVASTSYRYRLVAYNSFGERPSVDASATTPGYAPGITLFPWSAFASSAAEQPIPEDLEDSTGTQLFQNGDNNAKALARVVLTKQPATGLEYRLTRSSLDVNVWANPDRTGPILTQATGNEAAIAFSGEMRTVWVEREGTAAGSAAAVLSLQSRQAIPDPPAWFSLDDAQVALTKRLVVGFGGHTQGANDLNLDNDAVTDGHVGMLDPFSGISKMATQLRRQGFAVATFAEDPGNNSLVDTTVYPDFCGDGVHARPGEPDDPEPHFYWGAYNLVMQMVNFWNLREIGIFGYSHGASSVRLLTHRLNDVWSTLPDPKPVIQFTGYIDAVRLPKANEKFPGNDPPDAPGSKYLFDFWEYDEEEYRFPYRTRYHANLFQRRDGPENDDQKSGYDDLRGGELNRIHHGPFTQTEDPARMPSTFYEVNINDSQQWVLDPFLAVQANRNFTGYHVKLEAVDHTSRDGLGGGKRDPDAGPNNKAIDAHPVVRNWLVWHITQGAQWTVN